MKPYPNHDRGPKRSVDENVNPPQNPIVERGISIVEKLYESLFITINIPSPATKLSCPNTLLLNHGT